MERYQNLLKSVYYDIKSKGSFGGADRLFNVAKQTDSSIQLQDVKEWLKGQDTYTNFRAKKQRFLRLPILVDRVDEQWQADLMDMSYWSSENDGKRYILVVIDVLSRYAWTEPVVNKSANSIITAFNKIFSKGRKPEKLQTDQGKEFKNKFLTQFCLTNGVHYFTTTDNSVKCAIVERLIRTLRSRIYRYIYWKHTQRYIDDLQLIVDNYNDSYHRTIKTSPSSVNTENQQSIVTTIQSSLKSDKNRKRGFSVNDKVKIPLNETSDKGTTQRWTDEVFKVKSVKETPTKFVYKLEDLAGEKISSIFYPEELQKVSFDPNARFRVSKVLKKDYDREKRLYKYFVRWEGWPKKFDSWVWDLDNLSEKK